MFSNLIAHTTIFKVLAFVWVQQERVLSFRPCSAVSLAPPGAISLTPLCRVTCPRCRVTHPLAPCLLPPTCFLLPVPSGGMFQPPVLDGAPWCCRWRVFCHQCLVLAGGVFSASFFIFIFFSES